MKKSPSAKLGIIEIFIILIMLKFMLTLNKLYSLNMYSSLYVNYTARKMFENYWFLFMKIHTSFLQTEMNPELHMLLDGREIKLIIDYSGNSMGKMTWSYIWSSPLTATTRVWVNTIILFFCSSPLDVLKPAMLGKYCLHSTS